MDVTQRHRSGRYAHILTIFGLGGGQNGPLRVFAKYLKYRKNDLILNVTPEKQDKTLELSKHRQEMK